MMEFMKMVEAECVRQGVRLVLSPEPYVYTTGAAAKCRGFFDEEGTLAVGVGAPDWPGILAHEFGHMEQHSEGMYDTAQLPFEPYSLIEEWYAGKKFPDKKVIKAYEFIMACELDAERRAVGYISRYQLVSDLSGYIARANGYIVTHLWAEKNRKWPHRPIGWSAMAPLFVPNDRIWNRDEVVLSPELEAVMDVTQEGA